MVADKQVVVKLADEQQAVVDWGGVVLQDARSYTPKLVTVMDLDDAITLAKAILAFAGETADDAYDRYLIERYEAEQDARADAEQALEMAEAKVLYEAELAAQEKSGALAGIAKTSPAYRAAVTHLLAHERQTDGPVGIYSRKVAHLRTRLDDAQVAREQAAVHFSACKHAADLKASILRAMVL